MFTYTAMVNQINSKASLFKFTILLFTVFLTSCVGTLECVVDFQDEDYEDINCLSLGGNSIPVTYNLPTAGGSYDNAPSGLDNFLPSVTFPDGIPSGYIIRLNGAEIQDDFVDQDGYTLAVEDGDLDGVLELGEAPLTVGAMRDGRNTFQVTAPSSKALVTFYIDVPGTKVHITDVDDGWNGVTEMVCRDASSAYQAAPPTPGGNYTTGCRFANIPGQGMASPTYADDRASFNEDYPVVTQTVTVGGEDLIVARKTYPHQKRGNIVVQGYLEGEEYSQISSMRVEALRIDTSGNLQPLTGNGVNMVTVPGATVTNTGGYYLNVGDVGAINLGNFENLIEGTAYNPPGYQYGISGGGWSTASGAGFAMEGSAFNVGDTPRGNEVMFIQGVGVGSRSFSVTEDGNYYLTFLAAQRQGGLQGQQIGIYLDGELLNAITPPDFNGNAADQGNYHRYAVRLGNLTVADSPYTLEVRGLNPLTGDRTVHVDFFRLSKNYDFAFNLRDTGDHDTNYNENETDVVRVTVCKTIGADNQCSSKEWLRSNVPMYESRLGNGGGFSIAFDQVSFLSTGAGVMDLLVGVDLITSADTPNDYAIVIPPAGNEKIQLTLPSQPANKGRINVVADLKVRLFLDDVETGLGWPLPSTCDVRGTGSYNRSGTNWTNVATVQYSANVDLSYPGSANGYPLVEISGDNLNVDALDACGLGSGFISFGIDTVKANILAIIRNTVGGILTNDLPMTRIGPIGFNVAGGTDFGPFYLSLNPQITKVLGGVKTGGANADWQRKWVLDVGAHTRGVAPQYNSAASRNVSLGSRFSNAQLQSAVLNNNGNEIAAAGTSLGVTISEDFFNQIMMGAWESGLLYFDFTFDSPGGLSNPFLTNVKFNFTSSAPWEWNIYQQVSPTQPNTEILIPDLLINFTGDRYYPVPTDAECVEFGQAPGCSYLPDYEFARMVGDLELFAELSESPDGKALRLRLTQALEINVYEVSSDWDGTTEEQLLAALDNVFTFLTGSGQALDIPFPEILSSEVSITDVKTDATSIYITIDVYNPICFPNGPDSPSPTAPTYDFTCQR